jgi:hypothetical protein
MEVVMKSRLIVYLALILILSSCSSSFKLGSGVDGYDDVYYNSKSEIDVSNVEEADKEEIAKQDAQDFNSMRRSAEDILRESEANDVDTVIYESDMFTNPYDEVLVDNYNDSYERRLRGFSNPRYGLTNYSLIANSDAWWYVSAYDPAFYNVVVVGDDVWVEPWYVSSAFGYRHSAYSWGYSPYRWGFHYGYHSPYFTGWNPYYRGPYHGWYGHYHGYWGNSWYYNDYLYGGYYGGKKSYSNSNVYRGRQNGYGSGYTGTRKSANINGRNAGTTRGRSSNYTRSSGTRGNNSSVNSSTRVGTRSNYTRSQIGRNSGATRRTNAYTRPQNSNTVRGKSTRSYTPVYTRPRTSTRSNYNASRRVNRTVTTKTRSYNSSGSSRSYNSSSTGRSSVNRSSGSSGGSSGSSGSSGGSTRSRSRR